MNIPRFLFVFFFASLFALAACSSPATAPETKPAVTVTPPQMLRGGIVTMHGTGFTPEANVISHLRRPDGSEFPPLPMTANAQGEIKHDIETFILEPGVYEVWVDEGQGKKTSEPTKFEVMRYSNP